MKHYLKLASVALALFAAPLSAQTNVEGVTIDNSFVQNGIEWQKGRGSVDFAVKAFSTAEGTLKFCGAVMINGTKGGAARKVPRAFVFEVNNRKIVRGFHWMPLVSPNKGFVGSEAACRVYPNVKINKDTKFGFSMSQNSFHG